MALTAAHRTLPFQSVVRVTNLKTNSQVIVRINDRGPFVDGRVIDLSLAAAKALGIWQPGLATVKLELLHTPAAIDIGGKWCVQIGAFRQRNGALELKQTLTARYHNARLLDFPGSYRLLGPPARAGRRPSSGAKNRQQYQGERRWCLSGTPGLDNSSIKENAAGTDSGRVSSALSEFGGAYAARKCLGCVIG